MPKEVRKEIEKLQARLDKAVKALEWISDPPDYNADFYKLRDLARQALREVESE